MAISAESAPLRVATSGDYPPFSIALDSGYSGFDIDLARRLAAAMQRELVFVPFAWVSFASLLSAPHEAPFDLIASGVTVTPERRRLGLFSQPYIRNRAVMYAPGNSVGPAPARRRIGVNKGGYLEALVRQAFPDDVVVTTEDNLRLPSLLDGAADCIVTDAIEGAVFARRESLRLVAELQEHDVALFFPRHRQQLCAEADVILRTMREDGTLGTLAQRNGIASALLAAP